MTKGWVGDSLRHSNAAKLGVAGPIYKQNKNQRIFRLPIGITHNQFIHGDFDKDRVPNIDDKFPFIKRKGKDDWVDEASLSKTLKEIGAHNKQYEPQRDVFVPKLRQLTNRPSSGRVKKTISTVHKLKRKGLSDLSDIAGTRVRTIDFTDLQRTSKKVKNYYGKRIIQTENFYKVPNKRSPYYFGIHYSVLHRGKLVEVQVKTARQTKIHDFIHRRYKRGEVPETDWKELMKIAKYADKLDRKKSANPPTVSATYRGLVKSITKAKPRGITSQ